MEKNDSVWEDCQRRRNLNVKKKWKTTIKMKLTKMKMEKKNEKKK